MIATLNEDGSFKDVRPSVVTSQVSYGDYILFTSNPKLSYLYNTKTGSMVPKRLS